jgi:hypothetical protein
MALFIRLIIRLFQLVFLVGTVFFSHNKSANSVFQPAYQYSRTAPMLAEEMDSRLSDLPDSSPFTRLVVAMFRGS